MPKPKRILLVGDVNYNPVKMFLDQMHKLAKGFMRLGHDARIFSYSGALRQMSPLKSKEFSRFFFKARVDQLLARQIRNYEPNIVYVVFPKALDADTIKIARAARPDAVFIGFDGDPWPKLQGNRIDTAGRLDIVTATNDGQWLQDYRDAGVPLCAFIPNMCDPDVDRRYGLGRQWRTDILWTGKVSHHADTSDTFREKLVTELTRRKGVSLYGCLGRPKIGGIDYLYAISGARIGVSVNAVNSVRLYYSDRLTHYLACGTMVLAKRVPDSELLFKDGVHLKYFETIDEFFELADYYLQHEEQRKKIADAGMHYCHEQFNSVRIAGYILDLVEKGDYSAPWTVNSG